MSNEYPASVTGSTEPVKHYKCLKWERRQVVSDEELAAYEQLLSTFPEMVSEDYTTHEDVCVEYSDTEVLTHFYPIPDWVSHLERTDVPITTIFGGKMTWGWGKNEDEE